jgi:hypothetical protein
MDRVRVPGRPVLTRPHVPPLHARPSPSRSPRTRLARATTWSSRRPPCAATWRSSRAPARCTRVRGACCGSAWRQDRGQAVGSGLVGSGLVMSAGHSPGFAPIAPPPALAPTSCRLPPSRYPSRPGRLEFKNNLALNKATKGMPEKSFTVEFWAKGTALDKQGRTQVRGDARAGRDSGRMRRRRGRRRRGAAARPPMAPAPQPSAAAPGRPRPTPPTHADPASLCPTTTAPAGDLLPAVLLRRAAHRRPGALARLHRRRDPHRAVRRGPARGGWGARCSWGRACAGLCP